LSTVFIPRSIDFLHLLEVGRPFVDRLANLFGGYVALTLLRNRYIPPN
jgi:hypothetical protein